MTTYLEHVRTEMERRFMGSPPFKPIPERMRNGIRNWVMKGVPPGHFLSAVLTNDLKGACNRADDENINLLKDYVGFFYYAVPADCWGSPINFKDWAKAGGAEGVERKALCAAVEVV